MAHNSTSPISSEAAVAASSNPTNPNVGGVPTHVIPVQRPRWLRVLRVIGMVFCVNSLYFLLNLQFDSRAWYHPFISWQVAGFTLAAVIACLQPDTRKHPMFYWVGCAALAAPISTVTSFAVKASFGIYPVDWLWENRESVYYSLFPLAFNMLFVTLIYLYFNRERKAATLLVQAQADRARFEQQLMQAELKMLHAQIEPHFLVNTLSNVQALIELDPPAAGRLLDHLVDYLRASIPQVRGAGTTLGQEVQLAQAYLSIMKTRMGARLDFHIDVPAQLRSLEFPPLVVLTLLENAVKHGIEPARDGGKIDLTASQEGERIRITVTDTGVGIAQASAPSLLPVVNESTARAGAKGMGLGLANLRERLQLMFGHEAKLTVQPNNPHGTVATIVL